MTRIMWLAMGGVGFAAALIASAVYAQQPQFARIRGTIERVDGPVLTVKSREGNEVKVEVADNVAVRGVIKISLTDVKPGSMVGVSAMPQPDGSQKALEVHIFPQGLRVNEGHTPHDLRPRSTMTNGAVETSVASTDGQVLVVKYKQGDKVDEKKIIVAPDTPIATYVPGSKDELKPGAKIMIFRAIKRPDGTLQADAVSVGRDGFAPPM